MLRKEIGVWFAMILIVGSVYVARAGQVSQTPQTFEFADGYYMVESHKPIHLAHDTAQLGWINLADKFYIWISLNVKSSESNPCSRREEKPCSFTFQVVIRDDEGKEEFIAGLKEPLDFRTDDSVSFSSSPREIPRNALIGKGFLVIRVAKDNKELFRKEWPLEIR